MPCSGSGLGPAPEPRPWRNPPKRKPKQAPSLIGVRRKSDLSREEGLKLLFKRQFSGLDPNFLAGCLEGDFEQQGLAVQAAVFILQSADPKQRVLYHELVIDRLSSKEYWVRAAAVRALASTDPQGIHLGRLLQIANDDHPDVVDAALEQVGLTINSKSSTKVVADNIGRLLYNAEWSTRVGALNVLTNLPRFGKAHVARILDLADGDVDWTVRESACSCLSVLAGVAPNGLRGLIGDAGVGRLRQLSVRDPFAAKLSQEIRQVVCIAAKQLLQEHGEVAKLPDCGNDVEDELNETSVVQQASETRPRPHSRVRQAWRDEGLYQSLPLHDDALPLHLVDRTQGGTKGKPVLPAIKRGYGQQRAYLLYGGGMSI